MTLENILCAQNDFYNEKITQKYLKVNIKTNRKLITKLHVGRKSNALSTLIAVIS